MKRRVVSHPGFWLLIITVLICLNIAYANDATIYEQVRPELKDPNGTLAADIHYNYEWTILPGNAHWLSWDLHDNDGVYGDFSSTGNDISFFLVNSANYDKWYNGETFSYYRGSQDVYSGSFTFKIPYDDTWYFIFSNRDAILSTSSVTFDLYMDRTAPTFSVDLSTGSTYSDIKVIHVSANDAKFSVSSIKLYIDSWLEKTDYDGSMTYNWDTKEYSNAQHTIRVTVSDDVGNSDYIEYIVNVYNFIPATTSQTESTSTDPGGAPGPAPLGIPPIVPIGLGLIGLVAVIGGVIFVKGKGGGSPHSVAVSIPPQEPPSDDIAASYSQEKKPSVPPQVVCPFCGSRTQAGLKCEICGADL
jgi:FlaG/FlaF family flagellin (archaellin)